MLSRSGAHLGAESAIKKHNRWIAWRSGVVIAVIGIVPTVLLYAMIAHLQAGGKSAAAIAMPEMHISYRQIDRFHRQLGLLIMGLVAVHVVATALDDMGESWQTVLIPGQWAYLGWPQAVLGYNAGILLSTSWRSQRPRFTSGASSEQIAGASSIGLCFSSLFSRSGMH